MPRRGLTRTVKSSSPALRDLYFAHPPAIPSSSPELVQLRKQWKWAAFGQFFFTFARLLAMEDLSLTDIENDLTRSTTVFLPRVMQRLLYTLTQDRKITLDNWQTALRKQYYRRRPDANPIGPEPSLVPDLTSPSAPGADGKEYSETDPPYITSSHHEELTPEAETTRNDLLEESLSEAPADRDEQSVNTWRGSLNEEESKNWLELPMMTKLDSIHELVEWQFHNPMRLRSLMKNDDDGAQWRIEPIGYDAKANAYWLIGENRLWIQRAMPKPKNPLKRKRGTTQSSVSKNKQHGDPVEVSMETQPRRPAVRTRRQTTQSSEPPSSMRRENGQAMNPINPRKQRPITQNGASRRSTRPMGTRLSARLRGEVEDEWQPVPEEWLNEDKDAVNVKTSKSQSQPTSDRKSVVLEEDSVSDLTELSEEQETNVTCLSTVNERESSPTSSSSALDHNDETFADQSEETSEGFVEWEMICVTLHDWEHIVERFAGANHYAEKALFKTLHHHIVPIVTAELREHERKRRLDQAVVHRKRSSRIAVKESEKEEARAAALKKAEEQEKMGRARRLEARLQKEEAERVRRETSREQRRKEREMKEALGDQLDAHIDIVGQPEDSNTSSLHGQVISNNVPLSSTRSGTRTPAGDDWELDCEICSRRGINQDDGTPMMCCGICSKWQHIICHDRANYHAGLPKRNWDVEEFLCLQCKRKASHALTFVPAQQQQPYHQHILNRSNVPELCDVSYQPATLPGRPALVPENIQHFPISNSSSRFHTIEIPPARLPPTQSAIAFTHYQPEQRAFSASQVHRPLSFHQTQTSQSAYVLPAQQPVFPVITHNSITQHPRPPLPTRGSQHSPPRVPNEAVNHPHLNGTHPMEVVHNNGRFAPSQWTTSPAQAPQSHVSLESAQLRFHRSNGHAPNGPIS